MPAEDDSAPAPAGRRDRARWSAPLRRRDRPQAAGGLTARAPTWFREAVLVAIPALLALPTGRDLTDDGAVTARAVAHVGAALLVVVLLLARRRAPLGGTAVLAVLFAGGASVGLAGLVALLSLAVRSSWRRTLLGVAVLATGYAVSLATFAPGPPQLPWRDDAGLLLRGVLLLGLTAGVGLYLGARRQLLLGAQERAERAEAEQALLVERARERERDRIAREMHDVLAHRLSMLALHAGVLEYRADAVGGDVAATAGVVRDNAHQALQELRDVLGVLRSESGTPSVSSAASSRVSGAAVKDRPADAGTRPPSTADVSHVAAHGDAGDSGPDGLRPPLSLRQLPELVADAAVGSTAVRLSLEGSLDDVPPVVGRAAYRVVQEGLTNARKHATGAPVSVHVAVHDEVVSVEVRNGPVPARPDPSLPRLALQGPGTGLVGVTERADLLGGSVEHGATADGGYALRVVLPGASGGHGATASRGDRHDRRGKVRT